MVLDSRLSDCFQPTTFTLERVKYFERQLLTVDDMITDQDYFRQKLRRHNRYLHGWGVVCGLPVMAAPLEDAPHRVRIGGGYALGPYGDEIYVASDVFLDLDRCRPGDHTNPCEPDAPMEGTGTGGAIFVAIRWSECFAQPVRALPPGCGCDDHACEYSRIRDSFEIGCLSDLPPSHIPEPPVICRNIRGRLLVTCPPCPEDPWVVLARVAIPVGQTPVREQDIDNLTFRRQLYSTFLIQRQLIECCCDGATVAADVRVAQTATVSVTPNGAVVRYFVTVVNDGPQSADNVIATDTLPTLPGINISASDFVNWTATPPGGPLVANLGTMASGESIVLSFTLRFPIPSSVPAALTLTNRVAVTTTSNDPNLANNQSVLNTQVSPIEPEP